MVEIAQMILDDLKVYADMQKDGRQQLALFQSAITAAEKASLRPINTLGAQAVNQGRSVWKAGPEVTPARLRIDAEELEPAGRLLKAELAAPDLPEHEAADPPGHLGHL